MTTNPEDSKTSRKGRIAAITDGAAAALFAGLAYLVMDRLGQSTQRESHGDIFVGPLYLAPVAVLFALAAIAQWMGWRVGRYLHYLALFYLVAPIIALLVLGLISQA